MSFWEKLKPAPRPPRATAVDLSPDRKLLKLSWDDGKQSLLGARSLRQRCPCAECVEEGSGRRILDADKVPEELTILGVAKVGNYALTLSFGDGHATGIYDWPYLRELSDRRS